MENETFKRTGIPPEEIKLELSSELANLMKDKKSLTRLLNENNVRSNSEIKNGGLRVQVDVPLEAESDILSSHKSLSENIVQYYAMPLNIDYWLDTESASEISLNKTIGDNCVGDYSNKLLFIKKDFVHIFTASSKLKPGEKLYFVVDRFILEKIYKNEYNMDNLQYDIANAIGIHPKHLKICNVINSLKDFSDYHKVQLAIMSDEVYNKRRGLKPKPAKVQYLPLKSEAPYSNIRASKQTFVLIKNFSYGIKWLGGYRNSKTGLLYYNASTQTGFSRPTNSYLVQNFVTKNTQTNFYLKDKGINLPADHSTQMWRLDHYIPSAKDVIVSPRVYKEYTDSYKEVAATIIQKHWRGMNVRKTVIPKIIEERIRRDLILKEAESIFDKRSVDKKFLNSKLLNMIYPYQKRHFYRLHNLAFKLNQDLKKTLAGIMWDAEKQSYSVELTEKINAIAKLIQERKILAYKDTVDRREEKMLAFSSTPAIKLMDNKKYICLVEDTVATHCKRLKEMLVLLHRENISNNQRIEILLFFRDLMESADEFEMKDELIELINRECILLSSGVPSKYLKMLRKRSEVIVRHFIRTYQTSGRSKCAKSDSGKQLYRCKSCSKYRHINHFKLAVHDKTIGSCKSCQDLYHSSNASVHFVFFKNLLYHIRKKEFGYSANPYLVLLQPKGLKYIIFKIWGGKSVISYSSALNRLRLPRWDTREPWTPWNCILLTEEEEKVHETIENVYKFYGPTLCNTVKFKNLRAKQEFDSIFELEKLMRTNKLSKIKDAKYKLKKTMLMQAFNDAGDSFFLPPFYKSQ